MPEIAKIVHDTIFELTEEEAHKLIDKYHSQEKYSCEEKALFVIKNPDGTFTGIDNTTGDCFCEDFKIESDAYIWLLDLKEVEPLQEAEEKLKGWW